MDKVNLDICPEYLKKEYEAIRDYSKRIEDNKNTQMYELMINNYNAWIQHYLAMYEIIKYHKFIEKYNSIKSNIDEDKTIVKNMFTYKQSFDDWLINKKIVE